mmetsp:Transcript_26233/g.55665  ORF Transcript_26233/g.55665 Transcript_26233/m.55665 type:complete len:242 (-) Transcript_26233:667-1392(-)
MPMPLHRHDFSMFGNSPTTLPLQSRIPSPSLLRRHRHKPRIRQGIKPRPDRHTRRLPAARIDIAIQRAPLPARIPHGELVLLRRSKELQIILPILHREELVLSEGVGLFRPHPSISVAETEVEEGSLGGRFARLPESVAVFVVPEEALDGGVLFECGEGERGGLGGEGWGGGRRWGCCGFGGGGGSGGCGGRYRRRDECRGGGGEGRRRRRGLRGRWRNRGRGRNGSQGGGGCGSRRRSWR